MTDDLARLLDLQDHDTHLDQLRHRRATLPERAELDATRAGIVALEAELAAVTGDHDALAKEQRRIEDEVATVEAKVAEVNSTLYGGTVTSPRALQDLQADLESLQRRQRTLEDQVIELMEQQEPLAESIAAFEGELARRAQEAAAIEARITAQEAEIDVEIDTVTVQRGEAAVGVAESLVAEYERLRAALGGVGVARLEGGRCLGCQLTLSAVERDRIKGLASDAMVHCEECGRLLVH